MLKDRIIIINRYIGLVINAQHRIIHIQRDVNEVHK